MRRSILQRFDQLDDLLLAILRFVRYFDPNPPIHPNSNLEGEFRTKRRQRRILRREQSITSSIIRTST